LERLKDRVAIVTGAASDIGRAIALRFHDEGARVFFVDRNSETLRQLPADTDLELPSVRHFGQGRLGASY
jgi:NAD(P)-dependent dehydrogenase (short-subunit alcohol dehydrogenase family)